MSSRGIAKTLFGIALLATPALFACAAPASVDGTPYAGSSRGREADEEIDLTSGPSENRNRNNAPVTGQEPEGTTSSAQTQAPARPAPTAAPTTTAPVEPRPTTPTQPAPTTPSCRSANPDACFDCCLAANPGSLNVENAYDQCLANAFDDLEASFCASQHQSQCNASTACRQHHACLQANGCLDPLS